MTTIGEAGTTIRYAHPREGGLDPFDVAVEAPQWFIYAGGFTFASTDAAAIFDGEAFSRAIPMGYKTIVFCQKLAVVRAGTVVRTWEEVAPPLARPLPTRKVDTDRYMIYAQRLAMPYRERFGDGDAGSTLALPVPAWAWATRRNDHALALSRGLDQPLMVARILGALDWH